MNPMDQVLSHQANLFKFIKCRIEENLLLVTFQWPQGNDNSMFLIPQSV